MSHICLHGCDPASGIWWFQNLIMQIFNTRPDSGDDILGPLTWIVWFVPLILMMFYGQRFQSAIILNNVAKSIATLKKMRDETKDEILGYIVSIGGAGFEPKNIERFLEFFAIMPSDMDPYGIVEKVEHIINVRDERIRSEVRLIVQGINEVDVLKLENILEAASALNLIYKVVRHLYLVGKRTNSMFVVMQLQMVLPLLMEQAEALQKSVSVFRSGQPIGDGIGALVAGRLMMGKEKTVVSNETVLAETNYENRKLYVLKAQGPAPTVGKLSDAATMLIKTAGIRIRMIIMVDAAVKLEGEKTGSIAEGIGAAIGGIGVEQYRIEELATEFKIPVYAIVIKQSLEEAMTAMRKEMADSADRIMEIVHSVIKGRTGEGDAILLIGVGNTAGIAQ